MESQESTSRTQHRQIIEIILRYWDEFIQSEYGRRNSISLFYTPLKNNTYIFQDFHKIAQKFLAEVRPYKPLFRRVFYSASIASVLLITTQENYFNLPFDFLRFQIFWGEDKVNKLLNWVKEYTYRPNPRIETVIGTLNRRLYESQIRLTKTDVSVLRELSQFYEKYISPPTLTRRIKYMAKNLSLDPSSVNRAFNKMGYLGILKYTAHINYPKLGLQPYLVIYPDSFRFYPEEERFICLIISLPNYTNFAVLLIPPGLEDKLASIIQLIPLKKFQYFWNFTTYSPKSFSFPHELSFPSFLEDLKTFDPPKSSGISINYQNSKRIRYFSKLDLDIIYELTNGLPNQVIANRLQQEYRDKIHASQVWNKTSALLEKKVIYPYFYTRYIGIYTWAYVFLKGQIEDINRLEKILRFMINVESYYGTDNEGRAILFSRVHLPPAWQHPFHAILYQSRTEGLDTLQFGWFSWTGASRRVYLAQLWNENENYWEFPYHAR